MKDELFSILESLRDFVQKVENNIVKTDDINFAKNELVDLESIITSIE